MHMKIALEPLTKALKKARKTHKLTQLELGRKAGLPQSHISKIEKGMVDLRASSLLELGRVLELELMLIPRQQLPMVRAMLNRTEGNDEARPAYQLDDNEDD